MDPIYDDASDKIREENTAVKQRFESFKLGKGLPSSHMPSTLTKPPHHTHGRSHSRNTSVSSVSSLSTLSLSTSSNSVKSMNDMPPRPSSATLASTKRPNSHHRRRSSVSTRRESAELMGVSVPDLPVSASDDNINLGDKDSIRRRALWALEGKGDLSFSKVEIPELGTPNGEKKFEFPTKPSFPPGGGFNGSMTGLMAKRDSFGKLLGSSSSSKDQLHTLVEEEEEEEENLMHSTLDVPVESLEQPLTPTVLTVAITKPSPARPRPASLNLRPLSLTPDVLISSASGNLPTPTLTPSPQSSGLKSLTLIASSSHTPATNGHVTRSNTANMNRQSLILTPSPTPLSGSFARRPSLNINFDSPSSVSLEESKPKRPSSISYKSSSDTSYSFAGLPTPEMTPTSCERPRSSSSADDDFGRHRPLSASEQHFLFKSHNALLARITDLERALSSQSRSSRSRSRPVSYASDVSSVASEPPSDEMLQLIADLKAERDELKRDVDGWRTRVSDLEKQVGIFAKRVEAERREAWVARSRVGLLEVEKSGLEKALVEKAAIARDATRKCDALEDECKGLYEEIGKLQAQVIKGHEVEDECFRLRAASEEERKKREELERALESMNALATPKPGLFEPKMTKLGMRARGFVSPSVDSESSFTDVESVDGSFIRNSLPLKAVVEEEEEGHRDDESDEENGLAGYEDEEDSDLSFQSPGGSSLGSEDDFPRSTARLQFNVPPTPGLVISPPSRESSPSPSSRSPSPVPPLPPRPTHAPHASLSKTWTFPKGYQSSPSPSREPEEVDRFFGCLDDIDNSPPMAFTDEGVKSPFSAGFGFGTNVDDDDDMPPFLIPSDVGIEVEATVRSLAAVIEEDEDEDEEEDEDEGEVFGEEVEGGIKFVFTPPKPEIVEPSVTANSVPAPSRKPAPIFEPFDEDEDSEVPFTFPQSRKEKPLPQEDDNAVKESSMFSPKRVASPSSIPRATALKSFMSSANVVTSTPQKTTSSGPTPRASYPANAFVTPPTKRGGTTPSLIPVASPLKNSTPTKQRAVPSSTFIRPPQRKPVPAALLTGANGSTSKSQLAISTNETMNALPRSSDLTTAESSNASSKVNDFGNTSSIHDPATASSFSSLMSSPLAARISFQTLTNFIPLSWTPRPGSTVAAAAACIIPESSTSSSIGDEQAAAPLSGVGRSRVEQKGNRYASREIQLEKLRSRLDTEHRSRNGDCCTCKSCGDAVVRL